MFRIPGRWKFYPRDIFWTSKLPPPKREISPFTIICTPDKERGILTLCTSPPSYGSDPSSSKGGTGFLLKSVCGSQKRGNLQTNFGSKDLKQIPQSSVVQDGNYSYHPTTDPGGSIYDYSGSKGCLSSHSDTQRSSSVSRVCLLRQALPVVALPLGLATAPRIFTKVLGSLMAVLRPRGIAVAPYLDDILIQASNFQIAKCHTDVVLSFLWLHGWKVNEEKSSLSPLTRVSFLGTLIDSVEMKIHLTESRLSKLLNSCRVLHSIPRPSVVQCMEVIVLMVAAMDIVPFARLHLRPLQLCMLSQ
ncbi:uncharacterized protein LOC128638429 [Bombina bombina]|uniref:uncharacterized protein LOC128638429 n=1 Tax=Bombina bombina TaxID=8345 RepID=UPI00235A4B87|nr:uncharacterized protein LOC128638429 [Bombina bombina]